MVRSKTLYQIIPKIIGMLFIVLFVYAATSKLLAFEEFKIQLEKSPYISMYANWMVWTIPLIELLIVGLFLFPRKWMLAFCASFLLMSLFTIYIMLVLNFSNDIPCSCGGLLQTLSWREHLVFNIAFITLAILGILLTKRKNGDIKILLRSDRERLKTCIKKRGHELFKF
tara:strand:- start:16783 stop:17292 length:510 start_codon:yes stop_codon:yes gene_type:complete